METKEYLRGYDKGIREGLSIVEQIMEYGANLDELLDMYNYLVGQLHYAKRSEQEFPEELDEQAITFVIANISKREEF